MFEVNIAVYIASSATDRALIRELYGRIEIDVVENLLRLFGSDIRLTADDRDSILKISKSFGGHKGILDSRCAVVIYRTLPGIDISAIGYCFSRAALDTLSAFVAEVRLFYGGFLDHIGGDQKRSVLYRPDLGQPTVGDARDHPQNNAVYKTEL